MSILPWIEEFSPYSLFTEDDPPVYLLYWAKAEKGAKQKDPTHSANFGQLLKERADELGVDCQLVYPGAPGVTHKNATLYLIRSLNAKSGSSDAPQPKATFF